MRVVSGFLAGSFALFAVTAGSAGAVTFTEANAPSGIFGSAAAPTEIGAGYDSVSGTGDQNVYDAFVFNGLPSGHQSLTFTFTAPAGIDPNSYSAGGQILYRTDPFPGPWEGSYLTGFQISSSERSKTYTLDLNDSFSGPLYLALNFTHGANLGYNISVPSNAAAAPAPSPSAVPLPAGLLLIGSGLAALGAVAARRRAAA